MDYSKQYRSKIFIIEKQQARITEMLRLIDSQGLIKYDKTSFESLEHPQFVRSDNGEERSGSEVQAYYEAIRTASSKPFKLSEEAIRNLHADIFKSSSDNNHRGSYRTNEMGSSITLSGGGEQITFSSAEPSVIKKSMKTLIRWTIEELNKKELHVITIISAFVYEFLIIHPFKDGNGRTSRALMYLLLIKCGYDFLRFTSLSNYLQENKRIYMRCIVDAQLYSGTDKEKIGNFIYFNYKCIYELLVDSSTKRLS